MFGEISSLYSKWTNERLFLRYLLHLSKYDGVRLRELIRKRLRGKRRSLIPRTFGKIKGEIGDLESLKMWRG